MSDTAFIEKLRSLQIRTRSYEERPGDKMPTVFHRNRTGLPVVIPSNGVLERAEIDYIIQAEEEKARNEKPRPKKVWNFQEEIDKQGRLIDHVTIEEK